MTIPVHTEDNCGALLAEIKGNALAGPWTLEASEIVDIIDNGGQSDET
jgi:hypothetical protein